MRFPKLQAHMGWMAISARVEAPLPILVVNNHLKLALPPVNKYHGFTSLLFESFVAPCDQMQGLSCVWDFVELDSEITWKILKYTRNAFCVQSKQFYSTLFRFGTVLFICFVVPSFLFFINKISIRRVLVFLGGKIDIIQYYTVHTDGALSTSSCYKLFQCQKKVKVKGIVPQYFFSPEHDILDSNGVW